MIDCRHLRIAALVACLFLGASVTAAEQFVPGESWQRIDAPEVVGWSRAKLQAARDYSGTICTAAVMLVVDGQVLDEWGETARRFNVHSIRKSLLSALYGIHVDEARIDLSKTMAQLGIDDNEPSLTDIEKKATVHDLLKARSGVYHPALYETAGMKAIRPKRGSHEPGSFFYYNNWDFNALGTIFERQTKTNLFRGFKERIGDPIGMQDFRIVDGRYVTGPDSVYPAYPFRMTARDMARFGLLFLRGGKWGDKQIIPSDWVKQSTTSYSDAGDRGGYGFLWWVATDGVHLPGVELPDGTYTARGAGGHYILIAPELDLVIVHRVNTDLPHLRVNAEEFGKLVGLILDARDNTTAKAGSSH